MYLSTCQQCEEKRPRTKKHLVVAPILSEAFNSRAQVDLINFESEPDGDYKYILTYQDHLTKFVMLRPLKSKRAAEVALNLLDIFCEIGAPVILQSDNGREFVNEVIRQCTSMWSCLKMVHGSPRHSQSQVSHVRRSASSHFKITLGSWIASTKAFLWAQELCSSWGPWGWGGGRNSEF